jgi:tetratricopeptide (TPR) repeat protein
MVLSRHGRGVVSRPVRQGLFAAAACTLFGCSTLQPSQAERPARVSSDVPISGAYSDNLLLELTARRSGLSGLPDPAPRLQILCDRGDLSACAVLMHATKAPAERAALRVRLLEVPHKLNRRSWGLLVLGAESEGYRKSLAKQALVYHPEADELLSAAEEVPDNPEALRRFSSRPGLLTLLALSARLVQEGAWDLMDQILELAALTGDREILDSPEFWYLRGRVRSQKGDALGAQGAFAVATIVRKKTPPVDAEQRSTVALAKSLLSGPQNLSMVTVLLDRSGALSGKAHGEREFAHKAMVALRRRSDSLAGLLLAGKGPAGALGVLPAILGARFQRDPKALRQMFAQAVTVAPESVIAWQRLGFAESEVGHYREAIGAFRNALRLEPNNPELLNNLAYTLCTRMPEQMDEAEALARRSLFWARSAASLDSLAEIRFRKGDQAGALRIIRQALQIMPDSPFYKAQEARIRVGDPKLPVPDPSDEGGLQ